MPGGTAVNSCELVWQPIGRITALPWPHAFPSKPNGRAMSERQRDAPIRTNDAWLNRPRRPVLHGLKYQNSAVVALASEHREHCFTPQAFLACASPGGRVDESGIERPLIPVLSVALTGLTPIRQPAHVCRGAVKIFRVAGFSSEHVRHCIIASITEFPGAGGSTLPIGA